MSIREALDAGEFGVAWRLPAEWDVQEDDDVQLVACDHARATVWRVVFRPDGALDLSERHREHLEVRLRRHARVMFDNVHAAVGTADEPRSADPEWTPMIDVEYVDVCGTTALRTTHRMLYEPGAEVIMGHVLVPTSTGLFELRSTCRATQTGVRECALMVIRGDMTTHPGQAYFDDPAHDESFANHPLSLIRAGQRDVLERLDAIPSPLSPAPELLEVPEVGCALEPPARFRRMPGAITRVSFCTTDGVETLGVGRHTIPEGVDLASHASASIRRELEAEGLAHVDARPSVLDDGSVVVRGVGVGDQGPLRHLFLWTPPRDGASFRLALFGESVSPEAELVDELWRASLTCRPL